MCYISLMYNLKFVNFLKRCSAVHIMSLSLYNLTNTTNLLHITQSCFISHAFHNIHDSTHICRPQTSRLTTHTSTAHNTYVSQHLRLTAHTHLPSTTTASHNTHIYSPQHLRLTTHIYRTQHLRLTTHTSTVLNTFVSSELTQRLASHSFKDPPQSWPV